MFRFLLLLAVAAQPAIGYHVSFGVLHRPSPHAFQSEPHPNQPRQRRTKISVAAASFEESESAIADLKAKKRSLYEILGAQQTETRSELKQRYVQLAKICHPDAARNSENPLVDKDGNPLDFSEIAAAWRILSDSKQRKRYDRALQAEEFSDNVLNWVGDMAKQAAPVVEGFGTVANSFFRKTTATTLAGVQAAATQVSKTNKKRPINVTPQPEGVAVPAAATTAPAVPQPAQAVAETVVTTNANGENRNTISDALKSAVDAAVLAGKKVDSMELLEKSEALSMRAVEEAEQAAKIKRELEAVIDRRLNIALHTPGSGLTAAEAYVVLEDLNRTIEDQLTPWDRAMLRHTVEYEIQELQKEESKFVKTQVAGTEAQSTYQTCIQNEFQAKQNLILAEKAEARARLSWEIAKKRVVESTESLNSSVRELSQAESQVKKSDWEMEVRSLSLERQAEKVRNALRQKEKKVRKELGLDPPSIDELDSPSRLEELNQLRNEERLLAESSKRLELMADRLFERAGGLRQRAQELDQGKQ